MEDFPCLSFPASDTTATSLSRTGLRTSLKAEKSNLNFFLSSAVSSTSASAVIIWTAWPGFGALGSPSAVNGNPSSLMQQLKGILD